MRSRTDDIVAGELRHPVVVMRATSADDGAGGQTLTWSTLSTIFCFVDKKDGQEFVKDGSRIRTFSKMMFVTWFGSDVLETDRLTFDGKWWNIRNIENIKMRNKFIRITAEAGVEQ